MTTNPEPYFVRKYTLGKGRNYSEANGRRKGWLWFRDWNSRVPLVSLPFTVGPHATEYLKMDREDVFASDNSRGDENIVKTEQAKGRLKPIRDQKPRDVSA